MVGVEPCHFSNRSRERVEFDGAGISVGGGVDTTRRRDTEGLLLLYPRCGQSSCFPVVISLRLACHDLLAIVVDGISSITEQVDIQTSDPPIDFHRHKIPELDTSWSEQIPKIEQSTT